MGYSPIISLLMKGWICVTCKSEEDAKVVLSKYWVWGTHSLVLKKWNPTFNLRTNPFKIQHLWALLLGFPL